MSGQGFHVHGPHDHELEHATQGGHGSHGGTAGMINQIAMFKEAAAMAKVPLPKSDLRSAKLIDGTVWDGKDPKKYAASFKIKA